MDNYHLLCFVIRYVVHTHATHAHKHVLFIIIVQSIIHCLTLYEMIWLGGEHFVFVMVISMCAHTHVKF